MGVTLKHNGRTVPIGKFGDLLRDSVRKAAERGIKKDVEDRLREIRCPDHGATGKASVKVGSDLKSGRLLISTCCSKVESEVRAVLQQNGH